MDKKMTQTQALLDYLQEFGIVDRYDAMHKLGIANITSVIDKLRKQGYNILCKEIHTVNRYGKKVSYGNWYLADCNIEWG